MRGEGNQLRAKKLIASAGSCSAVVIPQAYIRFTGDMNAAAVLNQILYWSDRTGNENGWFAKSYAQWTKETGLSEYQIRKIVKRLQSLGVETCLKRADGSPTVHYRIDYEVFEKALSDFLGVETTESMPKKLQNPNAENEGNDLQTIVQETKEKEYMIEEKTISFASEKREPKSDSDYEFVEVARQTALPRDVRLAEKSAERWVIEGNMRDLPQMRAVSVLVGRRYGAAIEYRQIERGLPAWAKTT